MMGSPIVELVNGKYLVRGIHQAEFGYLGVPSMTAVTVNKSMKNLIEVFLNKLTVYIDLSCISHEENQITANELQYFVTYMNTERSWQINYPL